MGTKRALLMGLASGAFAGLILSRLAQHLGQTGQPGLAWRVMRRLNPWVARAYRPDGPNSGFVLLLTTTGRRSGQPHVTPLQYELVDGAFYVAAARGRQADWFRNVEANPRVTVMVNDRRFAAAAEAVIDPERIADYLALRRARHPTMIKAMLLLHGLPPKADRADLVQLAQKLALVILRPAAGAS